VNRHNAPVRNREVTRHAQLITIDGVDDDAANVGEREHLSHC
jgi:hypothetical protein